LGRVTRVFGDDQVTIKHKNLGYQKWENGGKNDGKWLENG
jgi:hypothetical protein